MNAPEPAVSTLPAGPLRLFLATRPAFLSVTLFAVLIGLAAAHRDGVDVHAGAALATLVFALMALKPEVTLFGFFVLYSLSGYVMALVRMARRKTPQA